MKLVVVILTVMSWVACNVGAPEGAAKFTPIKERTDNLILRDFILAPAQQKGYSPQAFVVVAHYDPVRPKIVVSIQAINHDGIQASPREGSCVDRYVKRGFRHHKKNTITINKGRKKIKLKFTSDGSNLLGGGVTKFEYTVVDKEGDTVTYKYKKSGGLFQPKKSTGKLLEATGKLGNFGSFASDKDEPDCD